MDGRAKRTFRTAGSLRVTPRPPRTFRRAGFGDVSGEARDDHGRWTTGGGMSTAMPSASTAVPPMSTAGVTETDTAGLIAKMAQLDALSAANDKARGEMFRRQRLQIGGTGQFADTATHTAWGKYIAGGMPGDKNANVFAEINADLRAGRPNELASRLDHAYSPPPAEALPVATLFRGMKGPTEPGRNMVPGQVFTDKAFFSTSQATGAAVKYLGDMAADEGPDANKSIMVIRPSKQMAARPVISGNVTVAEWLLPRGSSFRVAKITECRVGGAVRRIIEAEWVA